MRHVTLPLPGAMRYSVEPVSRAQMASKPEATAIGVPSRRTAEATFLRARSTRTSRASSLHATQAEPPRSASVSVGQNGPAPAQALTWIDPGTLPDGRAAAGAATTRPASRMEERRMLEAWASGPPGSGRSALVPRHLQPERLAVAVRRGPQAARELGAHGGGRAVARPPGDDLQRVVGGLQQALGQAQPLARQPLAGRHADGRPE